MTTNKWVYSTNIDALENYKTSKKANWRYTDKELYKFNELGINLSTALYIKAQNKQANFYTSYTHNPKIDTHSNELKNKEVIYVNHYKNDFVNNVNDDLFIDYHEYEQWNPIDKKTKAFKRLKNNVENIKKQKDKKKKKRSEQHIVISDLTIQPSMKVFYTVCNMLWATREQADEYWKKYHYKWKANGMPENWVGVLSNAIRRANKLNIKANPPNDMDHCGLPEKLRAG